MFERGCGGGMCEGLVKGERGKENDGSRRRKRGSEKVRGKRNKPCS